MTSSKLPPHTEELAIRFVNTVAWRLRAESEERLRSPEALLAWLEQNGILSSSETRRLAQRWKQRPRDAAAAYEGAVRLRDAIYELFIAQIRKRAPSSSALELFSEFLWYEPSMLRLDWQNQRLTWRQRSTAGEASDLLKPIALSAAELMTGTRAQRIKQCEDDRGCGWLFVDESRLQNRRWCSMGDCGNIAKVRRHRKRIGRPHQGPIKS